MFVDCDMALVRKNIEAMQKMNSIIKMKDFNAVCDYFQIKRLEKPFTEDNIPRIQKEMKVSIRIYEEQDDIIVPIYAPVHSKYDMIIRLLRRGEKYDLIGNENVIPKRFFCTLSPKCNYYTDKNINHLKRHQEKCLELSTQQITAKQKKYGSPGDVIDEMIKAGILPPDARNYRKTSFLTFDIETTEIKENTDVKNHGLSVVGTSMLCSIGKFIMSR